MEFIDLDLSETEFRFLDKETNVELEISKLLSEQDNKNQNLNDVDEEIARLIHNFEEEERQRWEQGKPSLIACASPLLSFLLEETDDDLAIVNDRLGISQAMSREDLEANKLQREINRSREVELKLELENSQVCNLNQAAQVNGPTKKCIEKDRERTALSVKVVSLPYPKYSESTFRD